MLASSGMRLARELRSPLAPALALSAAALFLARDPGDGSLHREYNWTMLHYAGNGLFSYEEDMYNPAEFGTMIQGWLEAKKAAAG